MQIPRDIYEAWPLNRIHTDWSVLAGESHRLHDPEVHAEVLDFARQMMRRAADEFKRIIDQLSQEDYRFANRYDPDAPPEYSPPELDVVDWTDSFRDRGVHLPIVLQAWLMEVGTINLVGIHPEWIEADTLRTDAFVCNVTKTSVEGMYDEWLSYNSSEGEPFRIDFSPDYMHKANISGGPPYQIDTDAPRIDSLVWNERHCVSFLGLVRLALRWNGFPGFEGIKNQGRWSMPRPDMI